MNTRNKYFFCIILGTTDWLKCISLSKTDTLHTACFIDVIILHDYQTKRLMGLKIEINSI